MQQVRGLAPSIALYNKAAGPAPLRATNCLLPLLKRAQVRRWVHAIRMCMHVTACASL